MSAHPQPPAQPPRGRADSQNRPAARRSAAQRNTETTAPGDASGADQVDIQRQVVPVLFHGTAGKDADLPLGDRVIDLWPRQFLVSVLGFCSATHRPLLLGSCGEFVHLRESSD